MVMSAPPAWSQVEAAFQKIWGYERFRPPQDTVIRALLNQRDLLAIMPTGGGKSICFQLPALLQTGTTLVVSPLVALMENQVAELRERNLSAAVIHGDLDRFAKKRTLQAVAQNRLRLLYLSPETLLNPAVWQVLCQPQVKLNGLILDEAHCLVQWGETFRPAYRRLGAVRAALLQHRPPGTTLPMAAFTATANPAAQKTLETVLGLADPLRICLSPYRNNLRLAIKTVWTPRGRQRSLVKFLQGYPGQSGLVYVRTRRVAETLAADLTCLGHKSLAYHAGLVATKRRRIEADWIAGKTPIVVCTSAFGMGINKPDVRFVAHYEAPGTLSEYIQEVGRGGRDGKRADALTLVSERTGWFDTSDRQQQQFFAQKQQQQIRRAQQLMEQLPKAGNIQEIARQHRQAPIALSILHTTGQLTWQDPFHYRIEAKGKRMQASGEMQAAKEMSRFLYGKGCRWQGLLRAFGCESEAERMGGCGHCDRCQAH